MNQRPRQKLDMMMCRPLSGVGLPRHPQITRGQAPRRAVSLSLSFTPLSRGLLTPSSGLSCFQLSGSRNAPLLNSQSAVTRTQMEASRI